MKTNLTNENERRFFQLEVDEQFRVKLFALAEMNGISASGLVRMLVNREHSAQFNGHTAAGAGPCEEEER